MSESNGNDRAVVPTYTWEFPGGRKLTAFLYDLKLDLDDLRRELQTQEDAQAADREFYRRLREKVKAEYGVEITRGEAYYLVEQVDLVFAKKNDSLRREWKSLRTLPTSTEEQPSAPA